MSLSWNLCGPPFLNGDLHVGHGVNFIIKDFTLRYQKQILKEQAKWMYNFDCHGLPVEREAQKIISLNENLVDKCLELNEIFYRKGIKTLNKLNLLHHVSDLNTLCTNDLDYKVKEMNFLSDLYEKGKIYRDLSHTPFCYWCNSPLANAEIEKKEIMEKIYIIPARLTTGIRKGCDLLFATTEFETVLQNVAIGVNPEHLYSTENGVVSGLEVGEDPVKGKELSNSSYQIQLGDRVIRGTVICSTEVHSNLSSTDTILSRYASVGFSPWGGLLDYKLVLENNIMSKQQIQDQWRSRSLERVTSLNTDLKEIPLVKVLTRNCSQEVCWRCSHKVGYALSEQWYLNINSLERKILSSVGCIGSNDYPLLQETRKFFQNPIDWNISRSRTYGTPLPLVVCSCGNVKPIYYKISDFLEKRECFVDKLPLVLKRKGVDLSCPCGKSYQPLRYTVDVWVDSGFLPLYYSDSGEYPTLIEGIDQKRGWFYTTAVLSVLKNGKLPYKSLYYTGWMLNNARKISKSNNTLGTLDELLDHVNIMNLRSYALTNANSSNTQYSIELVENEKKYCNSITNALKFISQDDFKDVPLTTSEEFSKEWIELSKLQRMLENFFLTHQYDKYWNTLKDHFLKVYSRGYINQYKKELSVKNKSFLKEYGLRLLKYISPVLGLTNST